MRLDLAYTPTPDFATALADLEAEQYAILRLVPPGLEEAFAQGARTLTARASTVIEYGESEPARMTEVLTGTLEPASEAEFAAVDLQRAYEQARQLTGGSSEIDHGVIRGLNALLQANSRQPGAPTRGQYRLPGGPRVTVQHHRTGQVVYFPPSGDEVRALMDGYVADLASWIADPEVDGRVAASLAHLALVSIHPFEDGNGRTGRLIADMILDLTDCSIGGMLSVSSAIDASGSAYVEVLRETQGLRFVETLDATPFLAYHMEQLTQAARSLLRHVTAVARIADEFEDGWIAAHVAQFGSISTSQLMRMAQVSRPTAAGRLSKLVAGGVLERRGAGRSTRYVYTPRLRRVMEEPAEY